MEKNFFPVFLSQTLFLEHASFSGNADRACASSCMFRREFGWKNPQTNGKVIWPKPSVSTEDDYQPAEAVSAEKGCIGRVFGFDRSKKFSFLSTAIHLKRTRTRTHLYSFTASQKCAVHFEIDVLSASCNSPLY